MSGGAGAGWQAAPLVGEVARHEAAAARGHAARVGGEVAGALREERALRRRKRMLIAARLVRLVR